MDILLDRPRSQEDWRAIRDLCGQTAEEGRGIAAARWPFFSEFWVGPYEKLLPEWTYVAREGTLVKGYLTGCPDTRSFERKRALLHRCPLFFKALLGFYPRNEDTRRFIRRFVGLEQTLESRFPEGQRLQLMSLYPAHLHVNVGESLRGRGVGQKLMEAFIEDMRKARVPGVHLVCGERPVGFYKRLGFEVITRVETAPASALCVMGRSL